jgi:flagellar FliJ protein
MAPSDRLKPVRRIAENRERDAAKRLGDAQRILQDQESKLEQLRLFQKEYQQRFEEAARNGMSAAKLRDYQMFMAKLQQAVVQQESVVEASRHHRGLQKARWQEKFTRTQAIGKVIERHRQEELKDQERKDQKETDERALRRSRSK